MDAASFIAQLASRKLALAAEPELSPETVAAIGGAATALASMRGGDSDEASFREALSKRVKALLKWQRNIKLENTDAAAQPVTISVPGHVAAPAEPSEGLFAAVVCSVALSREAAGSGAQDATQPLVGSTLDEVCAGLLSIHATGEATAAFAKSAEWRAWVQHLHQVAVGTTSERRPAGLLGEELAAPSADSTAAIGATVEAFVQLEDEDPHPAEGEPSAKSARAETTEAAAEGRAPAAADSTVATASAAQRVRGVLPAPAVDQDRLLAAIADGEVDAAARTATGATAQVARLLRAPLVGQIRIRLYRFLRDAYNSVDTGMVEGDVARYAMFRQGRDWKAQFGSTFGHFRNADRTVHDPEEYYTLGEDENLRGWMHLLVMPFAILAATPNLHVDPSKLISPDAYRWIRGQVRLGCWNPEGQLSSFRAMEGTWEVEHPERMSDYETAVYDALWGEIIEDIPSRWRPAVLHAPRAVATPPPPPAGKTFPSNRKCFGCGGYGHPMAKCPKEAEKTKKEKAKKTS